MELDVGLKNHMSKTYGWMMMGVLTTFVIGYGLLSTGLIFDLLITIPYFPIIVLIAQLGVVFSLTARLAKIKEGTAKVLFFVYSSVMGLTMSIILLMYDANSILLAFMGAVILFGMLCIFGSVTKVDLSKVGSICMVGLFSMIIFSLVSMLFGITVNDLLYSIIGLFIFIGITAWDAQKCKRLYVMHQGDIEMLNKLSIYSALDLYLDFINIFIYLLRILNKRK